MNTVVVAGADTALGRAVAATLAKQCTVLVLGVRDLDTGGDVADALDADTVVIRADPRDEFDVERLMEQASKAGDQSGIDLVAPCAQVYHGPVGDTPLSATPYSAFDDTLRTNARGVFTAIIEALPHLTADARVLVPTGAVAHGDNAGYGIFAVAAAATEAIVRGFSQERGDVAIAALEVGAAAGTGAFDPDTAGELFSLAATRPANELDGARLTPGDLETTVD